MLDYVFVVALIPQRTPSSSRDRPFVRVSEGTRTPDRLDHNQELYQLSYAHQALRRRLAA